MIGIEVVEYVTAETHSLLMQQAFGEGNELAPGNDAVLVLVKNIE